MFSKTPFVVFRPAYIWKYFKNLYVKGQDNFQTQQLILIYTEDNIYFNL